MWALFWSGVIVAFVGFIIGYFFINIQSGRFNVIGDGSLVVGAVMMMISGIQSLLNS